MNIAKGWIQSGRYHSYRPLLEVEEKKLTEFLAKIQENKKFHEAKKTREFYPDHLRQPWICCGTPQMDCTILEPAVVDLRLEEPFTESRNEIENFEHSSSRNIGRWEGKE